MSDIKQLPNSGTQKGQRDFLFSLVTIGWILTIVALKLDWLSIEEVQLVGVTFDRWWVAAGVFGGIYALGEFGRKRTDAELNK